MTLLYAIVVATQALLLRPDPALTPGSVAAVDTAALCHGWSAAHPRHVTAAMKRRVYAAYHATRHAGTCCEVDHLIPRELGGADTVANLWPEPYPDAYRKDSVENWTHAQVCRGQLDVQFAQRVFAQDWTQLYHAMHRAGPR